VNCHARVQLWDTRLTAADAIHRWNASAGQSCQALSWSPVDRASFASAGDDGACRVWRVEADRPVATFGPQGGEGLWDVKFHPSFPGTVASCGVRGALDVWDTRSGGVPVATTAVGAEALGVDWCKYGPHTLAVACADHSVKLFDPRSMAKGATSTLTGHSLSLLSLQWSPWSRTDLLSTSYDLHAALWDNGSFLASSLQRRWSHHSEFVKSCSFSHLVRNTAATVAWDRRLVVFRVDL